jgi:hypothetical protein
MFPKLKSSAILEIALYRAHLRSLELSGNLERTLLYCNPHGLFQ